VPSEAKFTSAVRAEVGRVGNIGESKTVRYSYRPFVDGFAIIDDGLFKAIADAPGDGPRHRPEVRAAFSAGALGIAVAAATDQLGDHLTRFVSFVWNLPDNDIVARGNAFVHCDKFPEVSRRSGWDPTPKNNIESEFLKYFGDNEHASTAVVYYCYAVMGTSAYLESFQPVLYSASNPDFPARIPLARDHNDRSELVRLGQLIAECEHEARFTGIHLVFDASWPTTLKEFRLARYRINASDGLIELLGEGSEVLEVKGVSPEALSLRISGHDVVEKWLRERSFAYLRRTFRRSDFDALTGLLSRVEAQIDLLAVADEIVSRILEENDVISPPAHP
jgi:hypothetical protein